MRDADAGRRREIGVLHDERQLHAGLDLGALEGLPFARQAFQHDDEFVAGIARDDVDLAHAMACPRHDVGHVFHEVLAVGEAGEGVRAGERVEQALRLPLRADVLVRADDADRLTGRGLVDDHGAAQQPDPVPGAVAHAQRAFVVRRAAREVFLQRGVHPGPVVGIDQVAPVDALRGRLGLRDVEHLALLLVDGPLTARHVQVPHPQVAALQHEVEQFGPALVLEAGLVGQDLLAPHLARGFRGRLARLEQAGRLTGEDLQATLLRVVERPRSGIDDADRAQRFATVGDDRNARVEADIGPAW